MSFNVLSYVTLFNIVFVFISLVQKSLGLVFYKGQSIHTFYCDDDMMTLKPWNKLWIFVLTLWVCILLWTVLFFFKKHFYDGTFQVPSFLLYVLHMLCTIMTLRPIKIYLFFHLSVLLLLSLYGSHKDNVEQNLRFIFFISLHFCFLFKCLAFVIFNVCFSF